MLKLLNMVPSASSDPSNDAGKFFTVFLTISAGLFSLVWFMKNVWISKKLAAPLPPGPRGLPVVGYLPFLGSELHQEFTKLARVYGPIYKVRLGTKLYVVVSSPSAAKEIARDQDTTFANRDPTIASKIFSYEGNDMAFLPYGPDWKKMRKIFVHKVMSKASVDASFPLRKEEVKKIIRNLYNQVGKRVDIGELAFKSTVNTVRRMLSGVKVEGEDEDAAQAEFRQWTIETTMLLGKPNISDLFPLLARFDVQGIEKQAKKIRQGMERFFSSEIKRSLNKIKEAQKNEGDQKYILPLLLELQENEDPAISITAPQVKGLILDIIVGASDTTSATIEWAMAELMKHQEIMNKVKQELDEVVGLNNSVEEFHLPKLRYLKAVLKETLRLHPALPFLVPRRPSMGCTVGGCTIPKGCGVFLNVYAMHRDPQFWDNPLEFQPERFFTEDGTSNLDFSGNNFQYLPFGSGRRMCAGIALAERSMLYFLASLLHLFEWKLPDSTTLELSEKYGITVKKRMPLVAIPTPRRSNLDLYLED